MFSSGAVWNWSISFIFFFFYEGIFSFLGMAPLNYPAIMKLLMCLVFVFGFGYFWVSKDMFKNICIVKMGALGKIFIFLILFHYCLIKKDISALLVIPGIIDLIYAILFIEFLAHAYPHKQL